ncbi:glycosyltransferase family 4 protein [Mesoflavibacter sp. SCSIO 43206]|jgi:glycosyltransferase involved in cell wall biosynthesis|uniref:glycosyltransferase family 4 protein n=1 Tax=Mesoflavibacter sp. SCSIO 43206 TaxID=2779362 RepID=UPI001CA7C941|nr:glycosyltransferase family 4 protein [Mesoflavibacter sp. SCSIO 43206]UAB74723.1 glycosyltransferase family 4 protein [Mesoflavibacter sp. SCSIO 43206]
MHIAYITPEYPSGFYKGNVGGIGTFTKNIATQLVLQQHQVTVFVHSQQKTEVFEECDVEIHFVKQKVLKGLTWYTNRRYFENYVNKIIENKNIAIIEAPEWTGFTAFMKFRCPLVIRLHGSDTYFCDLERRKVKFKNKFFEKTALKGADEIVGVSEFVSKKTKKLFNISRTITVIHNAIDISVFQPNHEEIKPKTLLYFGTIIRKKGVLQIAKAYNRVVEKDKEIKLFFLGRDNKDTQNGKYTLSMLEDLLSPQAKANFTHINAVPYKDVIKYIQQADVVLLPSFAEAFPMSWLEAMALEKKMITSNIGWANEVMINEETGFMINPNDIDAFCDKIEKMLNDEIKANFMAKSARQRILQHFDMKSSFKKNLGFYRKLIK